MQNARANIEITSSVIDIEFNTTLHGLVCIFPTLCKELLKEYFLISSYLSLFFFFHFHFFRFHIDFHFSDQFLTIADSPPVESHVLTSDACQALNAPIQSAALLLLILATSSIRLQWGSLPSPQCSHQLCSAPQLPTLDAWSQHRWSTAVRNRLEQDKISYLSTGIRLQSLFHTLTTTVTNWNQSWSGLATDKQDRHICQIHFWKHVFQLHLNCILQDGVTFVLNHLFYHQIHCLLWFFFPIICTTWFVHLRSHEHCSLSSNGFEANSKDTFALLLGSVPEKYLCLNVFGGIWYSLSFDVLGSL